MSDHHATQQLTEAGALQQRTRRQSRWFVRFLVVLGFGQWAYSALIGIAPVWLIIASAGLWAAFVAGISVWANRQPAVPRFASRLMAVWGGGFAVLWGALMVSGTRVDPSWRLGWYVVGGLVVAVWSWLLAGWMHRRTTRSAAATDVVA